MSAEVKLGMKAAPNGSAAAAEAAAESQETREWIDSMEYVLKHAGPDRANRLLQELGGYLDRQGVVLPFAATTPYLNSIPADQQPAFPGSQELERRIKSLVRWNALAMVVRANRES